MEPWMEVFLTVFSSVLASSGLWAYIEHKRTKNDATKNLLLGLAHDRIVFLGEKYINRGCITKDEYEDYIKYLWEPYAAAGGNGTGEKIKKEVDKLPFNKPQKD